MRLQVSELGARLSAFPAELVASLKTDECVDPAYGYHLDRELVELAIDDVAPLSRALTRHHIRPVQVYDLTGFGRDRIAAESCFKSQALALYSRHHAVCGARALRMAYAAATQATTQRCPDASSLGGEGTMPPQCGRISSTTKVNRQGGSGTRSFGRYGD